MYGQFVADIVAGRGRGLTADAVRKNFGEGRVVDVNEAVRRNMIDRVVPYPSEALNYAARYTSSRRAEADRDYAHCAIRIAERQAATSYDEAQRQADLDYTEMGIRIAERY